jgi:hypothetical protein
MPAMKWLQLCNHPQGVAGAARSYNIITLKLMAIP